MTLTGLESQERPHDLRGAVLRRSAPPGRVLTATLPSVSIRAGFIIDGPEC